MTTKGITLLFLLLGSVVYAQKNQAVRLIWRINQGDTLKYLTVMESIDSADFNYDFRMLGDSSQRADSITKMLFDRIRSYTSDYNYVSKLSRAGDDIIDIVMVAAPKKNVAAEENGDLMSATLAMSRGVVLRGSVYANGGIHSFWLNSRQKNLLAVMFELPSKSVRIGETWNLDVSLIGNDQNFICDSSFRKNEVKLVDLEFSNGDTIALLAYHIEEFVTGQMASVFMSKQQQSSIHITHVAEARFSIRQGRWLSYDGIMSYDMLGFMGSTKQRTKFSLVKQ